MFPVLGKDLSNQKLLPYLLDLFNTDNIDVKIAVIKATTKFIITSGVDSLNSLI